MTTQHAPAAVIGKFISVFTQIMNHQRITDDPDLQSGKHNFLTEVLGQIQVFEAREHTVLTNGNLSAAGQQAQMAELIKELMMGPLAKIPQKRESIDAQYRDLHRSVFALPAAPSGQSEVISEMRDGEVRTWFRTLSEPERMTQYTVALQQNNIDIIRAVRRAPGLPLLAPQYQQRVDREHIEIVHPEEARRLKSLDEYREVLQILADLALRTFDGYGDGVIPNFSAPPIADGRVKWGYWYDYGVERKRMVQTSAR